jgi:hypothetical protein
MARKKEKREESSVFEIIVVLAIVAIVAATGQVLIHSNGGAGIGSNGITGFSVSESQVAPADEFIDIGVKSIDVNPPSPLIGTPFEVTVTVANEGKATITTPFYVKLEISPVDEDSKPTVLDAVVGKALAPGDQVSLSFKIAMIANEGAFKIIATADSTAKLDDANSANNQRSKTLIITSQ